MAVNVNVGGNTDPLERAVLAAINRINKSGRLKIKIDEKGVTQPLGRMTRSADEFTKSLEASNARVLAFGASVGIINAVTNAFKGLVTATMEVEKNLMDINVVMGLSNKQLDKFGSGLFKVAKETGAGFQAASDAATEFARQGLTVVETLKRTKDALILTRLTGMDAADSVKSLTAAMNTFGSQVKDSTELVSKFAAVDVKFAVSAGDFAQAISRAGQSAKEAGVDINEFIGMVTAAQERTARGGAVIGNALKTIFTRTQKPGTLKQLEAINVAVRDLNGRTLEADVILGNLAQRWDKLTDAQRATTGQTVAGMFQINILKAVLADTAKANSVYAESSKIAANATDESTKKNELLRQTMSALAGETGVAVEEMAKKIGDLALAPGINNILDSIKGAAEWFTGMLGDGEGQGNDFAKGLLKGVGNILTGPGMVMIAAIMGKLFINAAKYASQSMGSLLNLNKAASQRKATEQALMQVLIQEANIQKEMLRTDISRAAKEKIILDLIRQQTSEAARLSAITKSMAPSLMRQGVSPSLSIRQPRTAAGIIPNYAKDPAVEERREANKVGYLAGTVKQGDGFVYNSREQFKNFPGIGTGLMPPQPSRAAEAYSNDFYNAHGFDPYAASGRIPNFSRGFPSEKLNKQYSDKGYAPFSMSKDGHGNIARGKNARTVLDLNQMFGSTAVGKLGVLTGTGGDYPGGKYYSQQINQIPKLLDIVNPKGKGGKRDPKLEQKLKTMQVKAKLATRSIYPVSGAEGEKVARSMNLTKDLESALGGGMDAFGKRVQNKLFAGAKEGTPIPEIGKGSGFNHVKNQMDIQGGLLEAGVKTALGQVKSDSGAASQRAFDIDGKLSEGLRTFMENKSLRAIEIKVGEDAANTGGIPNKVFAKMEQEGREPSSAFKMNQTRATEARRRIDRAAVVMRKGASGIIPNFANPLYDAIGRERAAGVPVSAIRVGSHPALAAAGVPGGLGVTNTIHEPNGLSDVLGAGGIVPNFAMGAALREFTLGPNLDKLQQAVDDAEADMTKLAGEAEQLAESTSQLQSSVDDAKQAQEAAIKANKDAAEEVKRTTEEAKKASPNNKALADQKAKDAKAAKRKAAAKQGGATQKLSHAEKQLAAGTNKLENKRKESADATTKASTAEKKLAAGTEKKNARTQKMQMAGMAAMMGASMLSGTLEQQGHKKTAATLQGAGTGAAMGMMFGPVGTILGAAGGALHGFITATEEAAKELRNVAHAAHAAAEKKTLDSSLAQWGAALSSDAGKRASSSSYIDGSAKDRLEVGSKGIVGGRRNITNALIKATQAERTKLDSTNAKLTPEMRSQNIKNREIALRQLADSRLPTKSEKAKTAGFEHEGGLARFAASRSSRSTILTKALSAVGEQAENDPKLKSAIKLLGIGNLADQSMNAGNDGERSLSLDHQKVAKGGVGGLFASTESPSYHPLQVIKSLEDSNISWEDGNPNIYEGGNYRTGEKGTFNARTESAATSDAKDTVLDAIADQLSQQRTYDDSAFQGQLRGTTTKGLSTKDLTSQVSIAPLSEVISRTVDEIQEMNISDVFFNIAAGFGVANKGTEKFGNLIAHGNHAFEKFHGALDSNFSAQIMHNRQLITVNKKSLKTLKEQAEAAGLQDEFIINLSNTMASRAIEDKKALTMIKRQTTMLEIQLSYDSQMIDAKRAMALAMQDYAHGINLAAANTEGLTNSSAIASGKASIGLQGAVGKRTEAIDAANNVWRTKVSQQILTGESQDRGHLLKALGITGASSTGETEDKYSTNQAGQVTLLSNGKTYDNTDHAINSLMAGLNAQDLMKLAEGVAKLGKSEDDLKGKLREIDKIRGNSLKKITNEFDITSRKILLELQINKILKGRIDLMERMKRHDEVTAGNSAVMRGDADAKDRKRIDSIDRNLMHNMGGTSTDQHRASIQKLNIERRIQEREDEDTFWQAQNSRLQGRKALKSMFTQGGGAGFDELKYNNLTTGKEKFEYSRSLMTDYGASQKAGVSGPRQKLTEIINDYQSALDAFTGPDDNIRGSVGFSDVLHSQSLKNMGVLGKDDSGLLSQIDNAAGGTADPKQVRKDLKTAIDILAVRREGYGTEQQIADVLYQEESLLRTNLGTHEQTTAEKDRQLAITKEIAKFEFDSKRGPGAFANGMKKGLMEMEPKISTFYYTLGHDLPQQFSNSMSSALMTAVREGGKLKDVLLDAANSFLDAFNTKMMSHFMDQVTYNLFGAMGMGNPGASPGRKNKGGIIHRNKGGKIPTMLTSGEYVMNRSAVGRMGEGGMDALNAGTIPKRMGGGAMLAMGIGSALLQNHMSKKDEKPKWEQRPDDRFQKNGAWKDYNMSTHYMQNNNRVQEHVGKLNEKKDEETQKFIQKWNRRQALGRNIVTAVGSYGLGKLGQHIESKGGFAKADAWMGSKIRGNGPNIDPTGNYSVDPSDPMAGWSGDLDHTPSSMSYAPKTIRGRIARVFDGKGTRAYNMSGGLGYSSGVQSGAPSGPAPYTGQPWTIANGWKKATQWSKSLFGSSSQGYYEGGHISGPAGIDKVPAMLSEGEYVINANSARQIGTPTLNRINAGKFNSGGLVGENTGELSASGANTNNINITVNASGGGGSEGGGGGGGSLGEGMDSGKVMDQFAHKIKQQVIMVVKEESRPGGLLG